jgi:hypothetical protein
LCSACNSFNFRYPAGQCASCRRQVPVHQGYCRLCRCQARLEARRAGRTGTTFDGVAERGLQLFLSGLVRATSARDRPEAAPSRLQPRAWEPWVLSAPARHRQLELVHEPPDFTRVDPRTYRPTDPDHGRFLEAVVARARSIAEARGWALETIQGVCRALVVLITAHPPGVVIQASTVQRLARGAFAVERTSEVLLELGLLHLDVPSSLDRWLERKLEPLSPRIRQEVIIWVDVLRHGDERTTPRTTDTVRGYVWKVTPLLVGWSARHQSLREVTSEEVKKAVDSLDGSRRFATVSALRSLFGLLKKRRMIFTNPAARMRVGRVDFTPVPLDRPAIDHAVGTAPTPPDRLVLVLAAVQALLPAQMRQLLLSDVDLGRRRLRVGNQDRPLEDVTRSALERYLAYRRQRWPNTANPYLLVTQQTAHGTAPASSWWVKSKFRGHPATLKRLREDRLLEELQAVGPDPLHVAAMFGIHANTANRYTDAVRSRIEQAAAAMEQAEEAGH